MVLGYMYVVVLMSQGPVFVALPIVPCCVAFNVSFSEPGRRRNWESERGSVMSEKTDNLDVNVCLLCMLDKGVRFNLS